MDYNAVIQGIAEQIRATEAELAKVSLKKEQCKKAREAIKGLSAKLSQTGLVPINEYGYMQGKLIHTNELMVHLGDDYFAECSASEAIAILERRIKETEETEKKLQEQSVDLRVSMKVAIIERKENEESEDVVDIVEPYIEDEDEQGSREQEEDKAKPVIAPLKKAEEQKGVQEKPEKGVGAAFVPFIIERSESKEEERKVKNSQEPKKISKFLQERRK